MIITNKQLMMLVQILKDTLAWDKPIMKFAHDEYYNDSMVSRGKNQLNNLLWIWNRKKI